MKESNSNTNENDTTTSTGLTYADEIVGGSEVAVAGKTRAVHYIDRLENGKSFDSSVDRGQPFSIQLGVGQVIKR